MKNREKFANLASNIAEDGMLEYESICEQVIDSMNVDDKVKFLFQSVLDIAQSIFEEKYK